MTTVTRTLEADLATIPDVAGIAARTVVALPPSSLDSAGLMRVRINGAETTRAYDPGLVQP